MAEGLMEITDGTFQEEVIESSQPVLLDFWAEWCGPCRMIGPIVAELAQQYAGRVKVGKVDVDTNQQVASRYGIRSIPTLMFFKDGELHKQLIGVRPKQEIQKALEEMLQG